MREAGLLGNRGRRQVWFLFESSFQVELETIGAGLMASASLFPVFLVSRKNQANSQSFCLCPYRVYFYAY
jgi:hypothetical protein